MGDKITFRPDVEAAQPVNSTSDLPEQPPPDSEKVVVLSFRGLQLRRIAQLQDQLIALTVQSTHQGNEKHAKDVDTALTNYGRLEVNIPLP